MCGLPPTADLDKYLAFHKLLEQIRNRIGEISNPVGLHLHPIAHRTRNQKIRGLPRHSQVACRAGKTLAEESLAITTRASVRAERAHADHAELLYYETAEMI
jgi:hypothetical protein